MLASPNRVRLSRDFRSAVRRGRRIAGEHTVTYVLKSTGHVPRFGFIVAKSVGGSVSRNLVRRRMRGICRSLISEIDGGPDVVIRALPGSPQASWDTLRAEISGGIQWALART